MAEMKTIEPGIAPTAGALRGSDLLGNPLTEVEQNIMQLYTGLKALAARDDLPPCAARNVRKALACMWQAVNDLNLQFEQLYDLGV